MGSTAITVAVIVTIVIIAVMYYMLFTGLVQVRRTMKELADARESLRKAQEEQRELLGAPSTTKSEFKPKYVWKDID